MINRLQSKQKVLNLLGLAQRAGKIVSGFDEVKLALAKHQTKLVLLASDLSPNSSDKVMAVIKHTPQVRVVTTFSAAELSQAIGKGRKVLALTDPGFSKAIINEGE